MKPVSGITTVAPGTVTSLNEDHFSVATGDGILKIYELQPESRNRMLAQDFLKGHPLKVGDMLGV